jgi:hypothetical protein
MTVKLQARACLHHSGFSFDSITMKSPLKAICLRTNLLKCAHFL